MHSTSRSGGHQFHIMYIYIYTHTDTHYDTYKTLDRSNTHTHTVYIAWLHLRFSKSTKKCPPISIHLPPKCPATPRRRRPDVTRLDGARGPWLGAHRALGVTGCGA